MVDKAAIAQWPEVQELVTEARLEDAKRTYLANDDIREHAIIWILSILHDSCMRDDRNRQFVLPDKNLMADSRLSHYWRKMLKAREGG